MQRLTNYWRRYQRVLAYLVFGGLTTLINLALFAGLTKLSVPYLFSNALAWLGSVIFAYFTNRQWVFETSAQSWSARLKESLQFLWYRLLSLGLDELIMLIGISLLARSPLIVKLIDQILIVMINWFFSKYLIFNNNH
ncbi:GtrA family protein [Lactobacillus pentosus] [Lactiplantibacillus mudanjiangensis]|uniref:GtrA family protein n=1 Tax=Lactiplantibacillus mudanjiangensis TaxID=1296538 RepID=UPI0010142605|nr:GtrA family protein [Lactiplantibacillus mudanjiangensis]VDG30923.1 GtrA family protein [Lactobacillus pentosus] [Lactiplantibacillus mudanjiangensis]